jgi:type I restriction enzyme S subunit
MSDLRQLTLLDVCAEAGGSIQTGPFGSQLHASDYVIDGTPSVMPQNIGDNRIVEDGIARVSAEDMERLEKYWLRTNDIVYSRRGDVERRALVRAENNGWLCGTGCLRVRIADQDVHDSAFISYSLGLPASRAWITRHAVGATMLNLNTEILGRVPLSVPDIETQRAVSSVLSVFDDKIALNRVVVASCARLADAHWRLAVGDKAPLSRLARFVNGRAFTKGASGTGRVVVRIAELNSGLGASTVRSDIEVAADHVARPGDLLFAWSGSLTVARWYRPEAIINQHIFKVIPNHGVPMWVVDQAVRAKLEDYRAIAADKATTMGHIQRAHLDQPVRVPPQAEIDRLDGVLQSLWDRSLAAEVETLQLEKTRDELLPLLMSGKVRVRDLPDELPEAASR